MAAGDTQITIAGNLVDDPELRFTPAGQPVARFRVASTPRFRDNSTGEWKDGDSLFLTCNVWRQAAENVAEKVNKVARSGGDGGYGGGQRSSGGRSSGGQQGGSGGGHGGGDGDPWATDSPGGGGYSDEPPF